MCGLVGAIGFLEHKHKAVLMDMLYLNTLRGRDSTGLSAVNRDREVSTRKMTVPGFEFIEFPAVRGVLQHADQAWLGHGRWRTVGEVNRANAQPFEVLDNNGDILLVGTHNGTLSNKWDIEGRLKPKRFNTDSEALFNWFVTAPDYKTAIGALDGAWSLAWWDPTTDNFHLCRNKERPMFYAWSDDHKVLFYASESWMLYNAAKRNNVELAKNERGISCHMTLEDTLYTLAIPQERNVELPDIVREGGYGGKPPRNFLPRQQDWWGSLRRAEREKEKKEGVKGGTSTGSSASNVIQFGKPVTGFEGHEITSAEFDRIKADGCSWCGDQLEGDIIVAFLDDTSLVCKNCMCDKHGKSNARGDGEDDEFLDDDAPFDLLPPPISMGLLETSVKKGKVK